MVTASAVAVYFFTNLNVTEIPVDAEGTPLEYDREDCYFYNFREFCKLLSNVIIEPGEVSSSNIENARIWIWHEWFRKVWSMFGIQK